MTRIVSLLVALAVLVAGGAFFFAQQTPFTRPAAAQSQDGLALATFASGCFWCTESDFDKVEGVKETISGYLGGKTANPTYKQVSSGRTGHTEAVQLKYDPKIVSYDRLLDYYWRNVDLLDGSGQFCDRGSQYRPVIFTHTSEQKKLAGESKAALEKSGRFDKPSQLRSQRRGRLRRPRTTIRTIIRRMRFATVTTATLAGAMPG